MNKENRCFVACVLLSILVTSQLHAQTATARFLLWRPSAISNAMGGVGAALYGDAYSAYFNPAGLAYAKRFGAAGTFVKPVPVFGDVVHSFFAAHVRLQNLGTIAGSTNLYWKGSEIVTGEESPDPLGAFDEFHWQVKISFAHAMSHHAALGISLSMLHSNLIDLGEQPRERNLGSSTSFAIDAGVLLKDLWPQGTWGKDLGGMNGGITSWTEQQTSVGLTIGLALLNLGPKITYIDAAQSDPRPTMLSLGMAYWPIGADAYRMMIAVDFEKQIHESSTLDYVHFGGELRLFRLLALRSGYFLDTYGLKNSYSTWGGGLQLKFFSVNVARYTRALLPSWHFDGNFSLEY